MGGERKTADSYVTELQAAYRRVRYAAYGMIGLLGLSLVLSFLRSYMLMLLSLVLVLFFRFLLFRKVQKRYIRRCEEANLDLTLYRELSDLGEAMHGGLSAAELEAVSLLPSIEGAGTLYRGFSGRKGSLYVQLSDCSFAERKAEEGIAAEINTGCWVRVEGFGATGLSLRAAEEGLFPEALRERFFREQGFRELSLPPGYPKRLPVYGRDGTEGDRLPAAFLSALSALSAYTPGKLGLSLRDSVLDVYIRDRFLSAPFSAKQCVSREQLLRNPFPEFLHIIALAETLQSASPTGICNSLK